jgi:hypothetical protein
VYCTNLMAGSVAGLVGGSLIFTGLGGVWYQANGWLNCGRTSNHYLYSVTPEVYHTNLTAGSVAGLVGMHLTLTCTQ